MSSFLPVSENDFEREVLQAALPVVVEFGAPWCQPCKQLEPVLAQLADQAAGKFKLVKVDVDQSSGLTMRYGVMGVPTVIVFAGGVAKERLVGFQSRQKLVEKLGPVLGI